MAGGAAVHMETHMIRTARERVDAYRTAFMAVGGDPDAADYGYHGHGAHSESLY